MAQYSGVGGNSLGYDGRGDLSSYAGWNYTYDANCRLIQASGTGSVTFAYDPLGRRVARTENGVTTYSVYDQGWNLLAEYDGNGNQLARYVHGASPDELLTKTDSSGNVVYYHTDGLGNVTKLTSSTGALLEQYSYDVYGASGITNASGVPLAGSAYNNRFMFTGREYLASLNLYDYRNRFYSAQLGRFLQPDPISFTGDPYNLYRYCKNNPVNGTDPTGQDMWYSSEGGTAMTMNTLNSTAYGHSTLYIQDPTGYGYYIFSYAGQNANETTVSGIYNGLCGTPCDSNMVTYVGNENVPSPGDGAIHICTTADQDSDAIGMAYYIQSQSPEYSGLYNNCSNMALLVAGYGLGSPQLQVDAASLYLTPAAAGNYLQSYSNTLQQVSTDGVSSFDTSNPFSGSSDLLSAAGGTPCTVGQTSSGAPGPSDPSSSASNSSSSSSSSGDDDDDDDDDGGGC